MTGVDSKSRFAQVLLAADFLKELKSQLAKDEEQEVSSIASAVSGGWF